MAGRAEVEGLTHEQLAGWRAFLRAHARVMERLERELEDGHGMALSWYDVLVQLSEAPAGRLRMNDLARAVLLSRAGLTRLVDRMASAGMVEREACEQDRRGTFVVMTPDGRSALRRAAPLHLRGVQEHFTDLVTAAELETLEAALGRIASRLEDTR